MVTEEVRSFADEACIQPDAPDGSICEQPLRLHSKSSPYTQSPGCIPRYAASCDGRTTDFALRRFQTSSTLSLEKSSLRLLISR